MRAMFEHTQGRGPGGLQPTPATASAPDPEGLEPTPATASATDLGLDLLRTCLPRLLRVWQYWTGGGRGVLVLPAAEGKGGIEQGRAGGGGGQARYLLSRYFAAWEQPRPESYRWVGG